MLCRGCVRRIVQSGVSLWRRLCSPMGALLDDDDDDNDDNDDEYVGPVTYSEYIRSLLGL